jgi:hypothetical protein
MSKVVGWLVVVMLVGVCWGKSIVEIAAPKPQAKGDGTLLGQSKTQGMSATGLKVYYAHNVVFYGTAEEDADRDTMGKFGMNVVDPSWPGIQEKVKLMRQDGVSEAEIAEYFLRIVDECQGVVFRAMKDGTTPKDVQAAIDRAKSAGKPVLQIPVIPMVPAAVVAPAVPAAPAGKK